MSRFNYSSSFNNDDDVSEADPNEIANMLRGTDDLDGDLFKNITKSNFSKTMPAQPKPASITNRNKSFNFDDDPLADFDTLIGNKSKAKTLANKPPIANTSNTNSNSYNPNFNQTAPMPSKSKSLAEDLFGPKTTEPDDPSEFKLNDKYMNMSQQSAKAEEEAGFGGGYQPSALSNSGRGGMKRNVSFGDDLFGAGATDNIFASLTRKTPVKRQDSGDDGGNNLMKTMPNPVSKGADDWLSGGSNNTTQNNSRRKSTDFSLDDLLKPRDNSNGKSNVSGNSNIKNNANTGSDLDWLGFKDSSKDSLEPTKRSDMPVTHEKPPLNTVQLQQKSAVHSLVGNMSGAKDSMNSSFADSIDNNLDGRPAAINPLNQYGERSSETAKSESRVVSPNEGDDGGWLNNLINKKGGVKKTNNNDSDFNSTAPAKLITNQGNYSDMTTSNSNLNPGNNGQNMNKAKTSYFLNERASTPENHEGSKNKFKSISMVSNGNYEGSGFDTASILQKNKHLESENMNLTMQLQHNKAHYELQLQLKTDSCENQIRMIKEDRENGARLFKEEKELLQSHIDQIEKEKQETSAMYKRKMEEAQKECDSEIEKLRQLQRESVRILKEDHEDAIKRIRQMKDNELEAAMSATAHTKTIESVLNLIEDNTKSLDGISQKVQMGHMVNLSEHEIQIRKKEESLKIQEDRLARKQKDYENEIKNLNDIIQRLEGHLAEQTKSVAEERWKTKQQEKKLEALQESLINEQRIVMEKISRDRNNVDRSKDDILVEQKRLMQQVYEEKRKLAEERAQIEAAVAGYKDKQHKDSLNNINIEAEISVGTRRLNDEKARLEVLARELKEKEFLLKQEKIKLDEKNMEIEKKTGKLEHMAATVNHKYQLAEELQTKSSRDKEAQMRLFEQENQIKLNHESRLNQIQQKLTHIGEKESELNQEKLNIYKERQELEMFKSNITCVKCKEPVRDFGLQTATTGYGTYIQNGQSLMNSLYNTVKYNSANSMGNYANSIGNNDLDNTRLLRQLKMQSLKDRAFINEERTFIETLSRSGSGYLNRSYSMNQLNSTLA